MVPGMWLLEGGQSATGSLLDYVIDSHALGAQLRQQAAEQKVAASTIIHRLLQQLQQHESLSSFHLLTQSLHVLPYHHGNRSPRADSSLLGAVSGLTLVNSLQSLSLLYLATLQAIAYGTRHILDTVAASSSPITRLYLCGGLSRSALFTQTMADVLGLQVRLKAAGAGGEDSDAMLLGQRNDRSERMWGMGQPARSDARYGWRRADRGRRQQRLRGRTIPRTEIPRVPVHVRASDAVPAGDAQLRCFLIFCAL